MSSCKTGESPIGSVNCVNVSFLVVISNCCHWEKQVNDEEYTATTLFLVIAYEPTAKMKR
jgi:hypothetical protein